MLGALMGGLGGGAPKPPVAKIGGIKINCIDANKSSSHHGGKFQGKNSGSGNGMGNSQGSGNGNGMGNMQNSGNGNGMGNMQQ